MQSNEGMAALMSILFVVLGVMLAIILIGLLIQCLFIWCINKLQDQIDDENLMMSKGQVWLCLIPLFNYYWLFEVVSRLSESLQREYDAHGFTSRIPDFGSGVGKIFAISWAVSFVFSPAALVAFVCWIIYWVKIVQLKDELAGLKGNRF